MLLIPLIYFLGLGFYFYKKQQCWNIDIAAALLLATISFFAIMIDFNNVYGEYGINEDYITLPTLILFCIQWTIILLPIHHIAMISIEQHPVIKKKMLYILTITIALASLIIICTSLSDLKEALTSEMVDLYTQHLDTVRYSSDTSNYIMFLPQILVAYPFPTLALFLWFYIKAFTKCPTILRTSLLIASIIQAITSIISAGRAAMIFWMFDFILIYSYFYKYLAPKQKRYINIIFGSIGTLCLFLLLAITISRFDQTNRDPLVSLYGYAGQHINNFCAMISQGSNSPFSFDREFPLTAKLLGQQYNILDHYDNIASHVKILVNVFGTFGGDLYLDLGIIGYISFFTLWTIGYILIKNKWTSLKFYNIFIFIILLSFITKGLFSWPLTGHYTTFAIMLMFLNRYLFKYIIKL